MASMSPDVTQAADLAYDRSADGGTSEGRACEPLPKILTIPIIAALSAGSWIAVWKAGAFVVSLLG